MVKVAAAVTMMIGVAGMAMAGGLYGVPEIDPASAVGALALLSGALLVIRARRRK